MFRFVLSCGCYMDVIGMLRTIKTVQIICGICCMIELLQNDLYWYVDYVARWDFNTTWCRIESFSFIPYRDESGQLQVTFTTDAERNRHFWFFRFGKVAERAERNNAERNSFDLVGSQKADFSDQKNFFRKVAERNDFAKMHKINFIHRIMQSVDFMHSVRSWYVYRFILYFFGICKHM